jgi:DNA-binding HxlR family transcriptional regulator
MYLEKELVANKQTGEMEPERIAPAQNVDDAVALLAPRHAAPILFALRNRGTATAKTLAAEAMPGYGLTAVYKPLDRLVADGLVTASGTGGYQLTPSGRALAPVFEAISAWATAPAVEADVRRSPGPRTAPSQARSGPWATTPTRLPAPAVQAAPAARPALTATPPDGPAWKSGDLFSHQIPARPISPAGGPRR